MRTVSIVAISALLASCSTPEEREHNALMDKIEKQVQLPKGAMGLNDYARFYLDSGKDQIVAIYVRPSVIEREAAGECEDLISIEGDSKKVPCVSKKAQNVKAGERLWLASHTDFPIVDAPGCQIVTIAFDRQRGRFEDVSCLGDHVQY